MRKFLTDVSLSSATAGFVAVLVGFTSSVAIVFQAALAFNASPEMIASWMWALGLGMGLCSLLPSLWSRKPVMVAWSTPGAALIAATTDVTQQAERVKAFTEYRDDVETGAYPEDRHLVRMDSEELAKFMSGLSK